MDSQGDLRQRNPMDRRTFVSMVAAGAASTLSQGNAAAAQPASNARNVVLVHGLFADGSCWSEVIARLQAAGLNSTAVQNPLTTLPDAVASAQRVLGAAGWSDGPGWAFLLRNDRDRGRYASERVGPCLCGGAGAAAGLPLRSQPQTRQPRGRRTIPPGRGLPAKHYRRE